MSEGRGAKTLRLTSKFSEFSHLFSVSFLTDFEKKIWKNAQSFIILFSMEENKTEKRRKLLLSKIEKFRLLDDDFMSKVFEDDIEATEFLLRIILQRDDLEVLESKGQVSIKNLLGRSVRLDIKARDKSGKLYNIEVQRTDEGAGEKRARYYSSILDANTLLPGQDFKELPETYVIFITEHDVLKNGMPLSHINRKIEENGMTFCDESHIIYVNGEYRAENDIGRLMHDFSCFDPDDMYFDLLQEATRYYKENPKGVETMCRAFEEVRVQGREQTQLEVIRNLMNNLKLSAQQAMDAMGIPAKDRDILLMKLS